MTEITTTIKCAIHKFQELQVMDITRNRYGGSGEARDYEITYQVQPCKICIVKESYYGHVNY